MDDSNSNLEKPRKKRGPPKGSPKVPGSGRKPGSKNKSLLRVQLEDYGLNIAKELIQLFDEAQEFSSRMRVMELICKYAVPIPAPEPQPEVIDGLNEIKEHIDILSLVKS